MNWGTYPVKMHVCVGMTEAEIKEYARGVMPISKYKKLEKDALSVEDFQGFYLRTDGLNLIYLDGWGKHKNTLTLIHELHHAVHIHLHEDKRMTNEMEAMAYQMEYLFDQIVTKLKEKCRQEDQLNTKEKKPSKG